jgi:rare lipoprotein A
MKDCRPGDRASIAARCTFQLRAGAGRLENDPSGSPTRMLSHGLPTLNFRLGLLAIAVALAQGCSALSPNLIQRDEMVTRRPAPASAAAKPTAATLAPVNVGQASWYGPGFIGKKTATGAIFDDNKLTAAHKTLPLGSTARVTNLSNGRTVKVEINDRGPYAGNRIIDLSKAAARALGMIDDGVVRVRVDPLDTSGGEPDPRALVR